MAVIAKIADFILDSWNKLYLKQKLKKAAFDMSRGGIILMASDTVYTLVVDGANWEAVLRLRKLKGRASHQREGIIGPPDRLLDFIDLSLLEKINPQITKETIKDLYNANHVGLVLPCKKESVPEYLITEHEVAGKKIPTVMNIWNPKYPIYQLFWQELKKYPKVMWVGSSANLSNHPPFNFNQARSHFKSNLSSIIKDRKVEKNPYQGSYTLISLIHNPPRVLRKGSIHPEKHPVEFRRFQEILPNLEVPIDAS